MRVLRKIAGVTRLDQVRNETMRARLRLEPVLKKVERRRECWKEKVVNMKGSVVEKVLTGEAVRKRLRDRPRKRWRDHLVTVCTTWTELLSSLSSPLHCQQIAQHHPHTAVLLLVAPCIPPQYTHTHTHTHTYIYI